MAGNFMSDWAAARSTCLTKALLDSLAGADETGFDLYYNYLDTCLLFDEDINFSALSRFGHASRSLVSRYQYKSPSPDEEPTHFSFFSQHDVNRLATLRGLEVVIYAYDDRHFCGRIPAHLDPQYWTTHFSLTGESAAEELARRQSRLTLFHDFRALEVTGGARAPRAFYLVTCKTPRRLFRLPDNSLLDVHVRPWFAADGEASMDARLPTSDQADFLAACDLLLRPCRPVSEQDASVRLAAPSDFLVSDRRYLYERWARRCSPAEEDGDTAVAEAPPAPGCFIVVAFCRLAGKTPLVRGKSEALPPVANFWFTTLAVASPLSGGACEDEADFVTPDSEVLCIFAERFVCRLSETYRLGVASSHLHAKGLKERLQNRSNLSGVPRVLSAEQKDAARRAAAEREKERRERGFQLGAEAKRRKKRELAESASKKIKRRCKCRDCRAETYSFNMARAGPERLCTNPYTATELLRLLGMLDAETTSLMERMLELSIAAMDLESQTRPLELEGPRPGPSVVYPEIAGPVLEGHVQKVQRPIMIGHTDALSRERGERWRDTVKNDSVDAVFSMFARYWLRVSKLHRQARQLKRKTASSLFEVIGNYQRAFYAYSDSFACSTIEERNACLEAEKMELSRRRAGGELGPEAYEALLDECVNRFLNSDDWKVPEASSVAKAFQNLPPGLLKRQLERICSRYIVFSFYG